MDDSELLGIVENEERAALGYHTGELANQREQALEYYLQEPFGNEVEGRSQVVDSSVRDTIEWMMPSLLRIFTASGKVVEFEPIGSEDVDAAQQATDACNYVFFKQNNGFVVLYEWFKDALLEKNGVVKAYYEEKQTKKKETYYGLTEDQLVLLLQDKAVEVVAHTAYPDPAPMQAPMQPGMAPPMLHDVEITVSQDRGKVCVEAIPPEEFLISGRHNAVTLQGCEFCEHRSRKTISDLVEMGFSEEELEDVGAGDDETEISGSYLARRQYTEEQFPDDERSGPMRQVWVREAYIKVDYDGDGIAELRRVFVAGNKILSNEETDWIPFAAITPNILPHRFIGISAAEEVMDLQLIKSTLWRQILDNLYLSNNPRHAVLANQGGMVYANLEDLLTSRPGGIVREYAPNAVRELETRFVAGAAYPMLEYIDQQRMNRTGVNQLSSGLDADAINKTARGAVLADNQQQQKIELVARIFAETGVKDLFKLIMRILNKYSMKEMMIRMDNRFIPVDPRNWNSEWDMTVSVGLGTGNKDQQLMHIQMIGQMQEKLIAAGKSHMISDKNLYATGTKIIENGGYKHVEEFITNPETVQPPEPPPNPDMIKEQAESQRVQMKLQADAQKTVAQTDAERALEEIRSQTQIAIAQIQAQTQLTIEQMRAATESQLVEKKIRSEAEMRIFEANKEATFKQAELEDKDKDRNLKATETKMKLESAKDNNKTRPKRAND